MALDSGDGMGRKTGGLLSLFHCRMVKLECARVLHESLLVPVLTYGSETMIWREKRGLGLGLYRRTTSEVCWVSGEWIKSRMHR